jgi:hypothetical protein
MVFTYQKQISVHKQTGTIMSSSKSNASYDTLISLRNKLMCLNGVITWEVVNRLEDKLGRILFMVTKMHHYEQGQKYG